MPFVQRLLLAMLLVLAAVSSADDASLQDCYKKMSLYGIPVPPPEDGPPKVEPRGGAIVISGTITADTLAQFSKLDLSKYTRVELRSYGGDVDSGIAIARAIRKAKLNTEVPDKAICGSICTVIFQGGVARNVFPHALLGYHSAQCAAPEFFKPVVQKMCSDPATEKVKKVMEEMNLSVRMSRTLQDIPFESAKCLTREEANSISADNRGPGLLDTAPLNGTMAPQKRTNNMLDDLPQQGSSSK